MSTIEKAIQKLKTKPKDLTYDEIKLHKPHPGNILKEYQIKDTLKNLIEWRIL